MFWRRRKQPVDIEPLIARLSEPDCSHNDIMNLGLTRDKRAIPPLLEVLEFGEEKNRAFAALALPIPSFDPKNYLPEVIPPLIDHLLYDPSAEVRQACAAVLACEQYKLKDPDIDNALWSALDDPDIRPRAYAAKFFIYVKDKRIASRLKEWLNDPNWAVRYTACDGLVELNEVNEQVLQTIQQLQQDPDAIAHDQLLSQMADGVSPSLSDKKTGLKDLEEKARKLLAGQR
ncbi:MAG TPA: HEAT repeat domain-containing protein [Armatimonadota bacterium]|nr:HEAT repeat domain-containing protein [Armatimonadota bacterium]HPP76045.1 HEAT repeat domain-containing protein [Armatimonadota bacterium]